MAKDSAPDPVADGVLTRVPDLDSLQLLLHVASTGSLGRAAAAHGITQPAVSARIRGVERLVGVPLVARSARGSVLTPAGVLVAEWAREVLGAAAVLAAGIESLRQGSDARLRVAASLTVAEHLLPGWLVRLARARPQTEVSLKAMNSEEVAAAVLAGAADIGFVEGPGVGPGLEAQVVARDRLVLVVPPGHRWARRAASSVAASASTSLSASSAGVVGAAELAGTRLVQREPRSGTRAALEAALGAAGVASLAAPLLELSTTSAICSAVAAGAGPAVLSELAVRAEVAAGRLVQVAVAGVDLGRALRAVWPAGQRPSGPARDLLITASQGR